MKCEVAAALLACASSASAFQVNAPTMMAKGSGVAKGIRSVAQPRAAKFLKEPEPNTNPQGEWFVRGDSSLSTALPWVNKPTVADGNLVGDFGFDPLSLSKTFDVSWLRSAELKHGRVCMLAAVGFLAPELVQHPVGFEGFHFPPEFSQMNAVQAIEAVPKFGLAQIVLACGLIEFATFSSNYNSAYAFDDGLSKLERDNIKRGNTKFLAGGAKFVNKVNDFNEDVGLGQVDPATSLPGDLGFDPLGLASQGVNPDYALAEIKHARLAMIGVLGMGLQQFLDQSKGVLQQTVEWAQAQS